MESHGRLSIKHTQHLSKGSTSDHVTTPLDPAIPSVKMAHTALFSSVMQQEKASENALHCDPFQQSRGTPSPPKA